MIRNIIWRFSILMFTIAVSAVLGMSATQAKSLKDLQYGVILYDYYQQDYFSALVEYEYILAVDDVLDNDEAAEVLKGGMMLSYGLADDSEIIFNTLLTATTEDKIRNRAWYYLAQMFYQRDELAKASATLIKVNGQLPHGLQSKYHYLSMLINMNSEHLNIVQDYLDRSSQPSALKPFLTFNLAINQARAGDLASANANLRTIANYPDSMLNNQEELRVLVDRARHALALLAIEGGNLPNAWSYLKTIRTNGLYSNRALLTYGWNAIEMKEFDEAIPALKILAERSISLPEVQEAKVLLAHIYELQGDKRGALKEYILAVNEYERGLTVLEETRVAIEKTDVPEEFVSNLEAVMEDSDWYGTQPSVDYDNLTPFLLDLLSSHSFQESLRELGDLYAIRKNLRYWQQQKGQHTVVLNNKVLSWSEQKIQQKINTHIDRYERFYDQSLELNLHTKTLDLIDQKRFESIMKITSGALFSINENLQLLGNVKTPYVQPAVYRSKVERVHQRADAALKETNRYIRQLEKVVRKVVSNELDQHEDRIKYYWAQARLAKARLYDDTLNTLETANNRESFTPNVAQIK